MSTHFQVIGRFRATLLASIVCLWMSPAVLAFQNSLITLDITTAIKNSSDILVSEFASSLEYIKLETNAETLFRYPNVKGTLGDSLILVKSADKISLFDRQSGKFIKHVGHIGEDPEGYSNPLHTLGFNAANKSIFAQKEPFTLCEYDISTGKLVNIIPKPKIPERAEYTVGKKNGFAISGAANGYGWMQNKYMVGYFLNLTGKEPLKLVIYDTEGEIIKVYPNQRFFEKRDLNTFKIQNVDMYNLNDDLFIKDLYSDTVFKIGIEKIEPYIYFETGKQSPPYEKQDILTQEEKRKFIYINRLVDTDGFLFFNALYRGIYKAGIYKKAENIVSITKPNRDKTPSGFINDLDNFLPFFPSFVNKEGELIGIVSAEDVLKWFEENPKKARLLPGNLKALENLDPEDNPIVMIAKLK